MQPSADQACDRPSSVEIDEENRQIFIRPGRQGHGTDASISEALNNSHTCKWIQRGNFLVCTEGGFEHGTSIHVNDRFVGVDDMGNPILERLDVDNL